MVIKRKDVEAAFTATTTATLNPGVKQTIAFANDGFQHYNTTKDFRYVQDKAKTWVHQGTLKAGKGMDVSVRFNLTPLPQVS